MPPPRPPSRRRRKSRPTPKHARQVVLVFRCNSGRQLSSRLLARVASVWRRADAAERAQEVVAATAPVNSITTGSQAPPPAPRAAHAAGLTCVTQLISDSVSGPSYATRSSRMGAEASQGIHTSTQLCAAGEGATGAAGMALVEGGGFGREGCAYARAAPRGWRTCASPALAAR